MHSVPTSRALVDGRLERVLAQAQVPQHVRQFVAGGKRLRAQCLFASALRGSIRRESLLVSAAATIELLQAASLLHDDIVDRCPSRRGRPTLGAVAGSNAASLAGGYLVHLALESVARLPRRARDAFTTAAREVSRGQMTELLRTFDVTLTPDERTRITEQKTASVFRLACELGALLSGAPEGVIVSARRFGESFGILFQIADDIDDICATRRELGRSPGADLRQGVVSLPLALALSRDPRGGLAAMVEAVSDRRFSETLLYCRRHIRESGALHRSYEMARDRARMALAELEALPMLRGARWMTDLTAATLERIERRL